MKGKKAGSVVWFAWIVLTSRTQRGKRIEGWINTAHLKKRVVSAPPVSKTIPSSVQTASPINTTTSDPSLFGQKLYDVVLQVVYAFRIRMHRTALISISFPHPPRSAGRTNYHNEPIQPNIWPILPGLTFCTQYFSTAAKTLERHPGAA